ncbi:MAG: FkbM family methyltransferase [Algoriphagus sp.]|uniref:FkbM family methyltransferase n=1 Tax=Algoriphagus sp. TaxID=1872435 RepID=UPI002732E5A8|nr:FkbM family methyltransferase [Algoriphagus sp.]MDP3200381.1 FkbM family methyltransferase [Algoriphagus sp.]
MLKFIRKVGISFINQLNKSTKRRLLSTSFFGKKISFSLEKTRRYLFQGNTKLILIGANDGISFDDLFQKLDPTKVSGLVLEPSGKYFQLLKSNLSDFKDIGFLNFAISSSNDLITIYQLNEQGLSKLPEWGRGIGSVSKDHLLKFGNINDEDIEVLQVPGINFMYLISSYPRFAKVDYLQIDTEGYDAEIIKMIDFKRFKVDLIKIEWVNLTPFEKVEVDNILKSNGFILFLLGEDLIAASESVNLFFK